jgi:Protein of unknown function (DUF3168)
VSFVGTEQNLIDIWLQATLDADVTLTGLLNGGVHDHLAPPTAEYPFIVYQNQTTVDVGGTGAGVWMVDTLYLVKSIARVDDFEALRPLNARIHALLEGVTTAVSGGFITGCRRVSQFRMVESIEGKQVRHLGGLYRVFAQAS